MLKKVFKILACLSGATLTGALAASLVSQLSNTVSSSSTPVVHIVFIYLRWIGQAFVALLPASAVLCTLILGCVHLLRRRMPLAASLLVAWAVVTIVGSAIFFVLDAPEDPAGYLVRSAFEGALLTGIMTLTTACFQHWLFGGRPKLAPEKAF
jgi:hypothetical protein